MKAEEGMENKEKEKRGKKKVKNCVNGEKKAKKKGGEEG